MVNTPFLDAKVQRKFEDFIWLQERFIELLPGVFIPPVPKKKLMERFTDELMHKKMRYFQKFIDSITRNKLLRSTQIFFDFLTIENRTDFDLKREHYSRYDMPATLVGHHTLDGILQISINTNDDVKAQTVNKIVHKNEILLKKLNIALKSVLEDMESMSMKMNNVSNIFLEIYENNVEFNSEVLFKFNILGKTC